MCWALYPALFVYYSQYSQSSCEMGIIICILSMKKGKLQKLMDLSKYTVNAK